MCGRQSEAEKKNSQQSPQNFSTSGPEPPIFPADGLGRPPCSLVPDPRSVRFCGSCGPGYTCQHISRGWGGVAPAQSEPDPWTPLWDRVKWGPWLRPQCANREAQEGGRSAPSPGGCPEGLPLFRGSLSACQGWGAVHSSALL